MRYLLNRFKEPSSWAGFGLIATALFGVPVNTAQAVIQGATALLGAVSVLVPEKTPDATKKGGKPIL